MLDQKRVTFGARRQPTTNRSIGEVQIVSPDKQLETLEFGNFSQLREQLSSFGIPAAELLKAQSFEGTSWMLYEPKDDRWPVRDQGKIRGTCVSFATLAALELSMLNATGQVKNLSEEFIYYIARDRFRHLGPGKDPLQENTGATFLLQAALALSEYGVCEEDELGYNHDTDDPAWTADVPQATLDLASALKVPRNAIYVVMNKPPGLIEDQLDGAFPEKGQVAELIQDTLLEGRPVAITLPVYATDTFSPWTSGNAWSVGIIPPPTEADKAASTGEAGHAICIIGFVKDEDDPTKGWFIFRNSWGKRFGYQRPQSSALDKVMAPGYGAITFDHVDTECWGLMVMLGIALQPD